MTNSRQFMLAALLACGSAHAADCGNASTQAALNACAAREAASADKELNQVYSRYRERLDEPQKAMLRKAQLAWITYRDQTCQFETSGAEGGSAKRMALDFCLGEKTRHRTGELNAIASCQEGDLSCPVPGPARPR